MKWPDLSATRRHVVVVGGSLAGFQAVEELRGAGFDGDVTVLGDEPHLPYDRPPLSKGLLTAEKSTADISLGGVDGSGAHWRTGTRAVGLDVERRLVRIAGDEDLPFDALVIATGATARRLPLPGAVTLRTLDDALHLRQRFAEAARVVVAGAGFIGAEVASSARSLGLAVTVVDPAAVPMERGVGAAVGGLFADAMREHGVDLRLGTSIADVTTSGDAIDEVRLTDGTCVAADVLVAGVGATPNTAWLDGSGLVLDDGVVCDASCAAAPGIVAVGDVARWRLGDVLVRRESWDNALGQASHGVQRLLGRIEPFAPPAWVWSDQFGHRIQIAGDPTVGEPGCTRLIGSEADRSFVRVFGRAGRICGVIGVDQPKLVMKFRKLLRQAAGWDEALELTA